MHQSPKIAPCLLERRFVPKVWGGRALERVLGIHLPAGDEPIGETWELYDRPDGSSRIQGGEGATIADLVYDNAASWLGRKFAHLDRFPLLLKYIDAREALSVQLHPDDEQASGDSGKTEAWVVLDAGENARIVRGLRSGRNRDELRAALGSSAIEELLHDFKPSAGDAVFVPAGTVHALGPDLVVFEVQQNSDLTYRLYDWGRPRELHIDEGIEAYKPVDDVAAPTTAPVPCEDGRGEWLIRDDMFSVRRYRIDEPQALLTDASFKVLNVVGGQGTVGWRSGGDDPPLFARSGDTVLVPAAVEQVFLSPVGKFEVLWTAPGDALGRAS